MGESPSPPRTILEALVHHLETRHILMPAVVVLIGGFLSLGMKPPAPAGELAAGALSAGVSPATAAPVAASGETRALRPPLGPGSLAAVAAAVDALEEPEPAPAPEPEPEPEPQPQPEPEPEPDPEPEPEPQPEQQGLLPQLDPETVQAVASRTGVPARAMQAYAASALRMREERPGCQIDWALLAAIGYVESHHGTLSGGHIAEDGRTTKKVIGPPLNGTNETRAIRDTDGGELDGDTTWDRAVGPMQFIPSTWAGWAVDANGDGQADPHNIDDASLAAARYLCGAGGDLTDAQGWSRAVFAYNRSETYVRTVLKYNNHYAQASHG